MAKRSLYLAAYDISSPGRLAKMPDKYQQCYLICYDICDTRRLQRVHRVVSNYAVSVQRSVFHARLSRERLNLLKSELENIINLKQDDVRIYPLPEKQHIDSLGVSANNLGLLLVQGSTDIMLV